LSTTVYVIEPTQAQKKFFECTESFGTTKERIKILNTRKRKRKEKDDTPSEYCKTKTTPLKQKDLQVQGPLFSVPTTNRKRRRPVKAARGRRRGEHT
jgi:hypothetical protein